MVCADVLPSGGHCGNCISGAGSDLGTRCPDGAVAGEAGSLRAYVIAGEGLTGMGPSA